MLLLYIFSVAREKFFIIINISIVFFTKLCTTYYVWNIQETTKYLDCPEAAAAVCCCSGDRWIHFAADRTVHFDADWIGSSGWDLVRSLAGGHEDADRARGQHLLAATRQTSPKAAVHPSNRGRANSLRREEAGSSQIGNEGIPSETRKEVISKTLCKKSHSAVA
jgi:hypothetical protein